VVVIGYGTCQRVMTEELGMRHVAAKFVPRILTADHKQQCVNVCTELRRLASDDDNFLSKVITGDESWLYGYDPETKQQSSQVEMCQITKAIKGQTGEKQCQEHYLDVKGIVHKESVPTGRTVNTGTYCDVLRRLRDNVRRRRPKLWRE